MGIIEMITAGFKAAAAFFTHQSKRSDVKNSSDVKQRAERQDAINEDSANAEAIRQRDLERIRREASE